MSDNVQNYFTITDYLTLQLRALAHRIIDIMDYKIVVKTNKCLSEKLKNKLKTYLYRQLLSLFHQNKMKQVMIIYKGCWHDIIYQTLKKFHLENCILPMKKYHLELKGRKTMQGFPLIETYNKNINGIIFVPEY